MAAEAVLTGAVLGGRFRVGERLARADRATVYRAVDAQRGENVVVTVLEGEPPGFDLRRLLSNPGVRDLLAAAREAVPPAVLGSKRQKRIPRADTVQVCHGQDGDRAFVAWTLRLAERFKPPRPNEFPRSVKRALLEEAGGRCRHCGSRERLRCDHVVPVRYGGSNRLDNGQVLCENCHKRKTKAEPELRIFAETPTPSAHPTPDVTVRDRSVTWTIGGTPSGIHEIVLSAIAGEAEEVAGRLRGPYVVTVESFVDAFAPSHVDYLGRCRVLGAGAQPCGSATLPARKVCATHHRPEYYERHGPFATYGAARAFLEQRAAEVFHSTSVKDTDFT